MDIKLEMLMARAAIPTNQNRNEKPEEYINDPFALITRPQEEKKSTEGNPAVDVTKELEKNIVFAQKSLADKLKDNTNKTVTGKSSDWMSK